jgi:hypothetical protein
MVDDDSLHTDLVDLHRAQKTPLSQCDSVWKGNGHSLIVLTSSLKMKAE